MNDYAFNHVVQSVRRCKVPADVHVILMDSTDHKWLCDKISAAHPSYKLDVACCGVTLESFEGVPIKILSQGEEMTAEIANLRANGQRFILLYNQKVYVC